MRKKAIEQTTTWNKNLNVGDALEGVYLKKEIVEGSYGNTEKYVIKTSNGELKGVFTCASLSRQFNNVPEGSYVWITYTGEVPTKTGRMIKVYDVEYDDDYQK